MDFETAKAAAERLGCTVRAVQKWASEGKLPGAKKQGRDWLIPVTSSKPSEFNSDYDVSSVPYPITRSYEAGKAMEFINSITDKDEKNMALCEYYYFTGKLKESTILAEPYLDSKNPILRMSAALFCIFSNFCRGHMAKSHYAVEILKTAREIFLDSDAPWELKAVSAFSSVTVKTQLHLPFEKVPPINDYIKYLPDGIKLISCYLIAYSEYFNKDYAKSVGIAETALCMFKKPYPMAEIYLNIISAMSYINLMQVDKAKEAIARAWALAEKDGYIMPFVEHYNLLQGVIEKHFKKEYKAAYDLIIENVRLYNTSWYEMYNKTEGVTVADNLTHTEFTIAMLYSRNWRAKEIASHMELSERTIMNYISYIYDKLQINNKKELEKFMLK